MKHVFQLVNCNDGRRSEPFIETLDGLAMLLAKAQSKDEYREDDLILIVATIYEDSGEEQTHIPTSPLLTIKTFMESRNG